MRAQAAKRVLNTTWNCRAQRPDVILVGPIQALALELRSGPDFPTSLSNARPSCGLPEPLFTTMPQRMTLFQGKAGNGDCHLMGSTVRRSMPDGSETRPSTARRAFMPALGVDREPGSGRVKGAIKRWVLVLRLRTVGRNSSLRTTPKTLIQTPTGAAILRTRFRSC